MGWILGSGLRFGRLVVALAIGLLVIGIAQLRSAPVDVYPEFMPPSVEVQTEALGLSAAEVEQLITVPLEQDLLNGVPWLDTIHSVLDAGPVGDRLDVPAGHRTCTRRGRWSRNG